MSGRAGFFAALTALVICTLVPRPAGGQLAGRNSGIPTFAAVDAAALGVTRPASVGLSVGDTQYAGQAGFGVRGGSLLGFAAAAKYSWSIGGGYAQTLATGELGSAIHTSIGGELVGGYRHSSGGLDGGALNLTVPLALTFGDPNRPLREGPSLALYAAPYAEGGSEKANYALGIGAGTRLSFGRLAIEFMYRDFGARRRWDWLDVSMLGVSYRLGR
jgi:hypothetical protein